MECIIHYLSRVFVHKLCRHFSEYLTFWSKFVLGGQLYRLAVDMFIRGAVNHVENHWQVGNFHLLERIRLDARRVEIYIIAQLLSLRSRYPSNYGYFDRAVSRR